MHGMFGSRSSILALSAAALSLALPLAMSSTARAATVADEAHGSTKARRIARITDADPSREDHDGTEGASCHRTKSAVEIVAGAESVSMSLERCDGQAIPASVDKLSILARPAGVAKPKEPLTADKARPFEVAPGIRRLDARLAQRLELVAEHFHKDGETTKIVLVSGSKSKNAGSYHASGRAVDFRLEGTDDEAVAAFCKTVQDTGCGFYPNSGFVHIDVRDSGTGHVAWIDVSKPGESPKYVTAWPLKDEPSKGDAAKLDAAKPEAPKAETTKVADSTDATKLPSLPAAVAVAPMEAPKPAAAPEAEATPAPAKKVHKRHHRGHRADHTI
jgi:uncharacterized protein YcbK (DUF882 family)